MTTDGVRVSARARVCEWERERRANTALISLSLSHTQTKTHMNELLTTSALSHIYWLQTATSDSDQFLHFPHLSLILYVPRFVVSCVCCLRRKSTEINTFIKVPQTTNLMVWFMAHIRESFSFSFKLERERERRHEVTNTVRYTKSVVLCCTHKHCSL